MVVSSQAFRQKTGQPCVTRHHYSDVTPALSLVCCSHVTRHHCSDVTPALCFSHVIAGPSTSWLSWQFLFLRPASHVLPCQCAVRQRRVPASGPRTAGLPGPLSRRNTDGERTRGAGGAILVQHLSAHAHGQRWVSNPLTPLSLSFFLSFSSFFSSFLIENRLGLIYIYRDLYIYIYSSQPIL